mmetsp:Transcript_111074/g.321002  ORF Transcript_111074/g.321002 Transcript_111074/m.321002 type:complete len:165 (-) Transcript_111074:26-520(-)
MFAARALRAAKIIVGVSVKDIQGSQAAMKKAIRFAQPGDKILALHMPRMVPEMLLSSMSDPGDASEDALAALTNLPSRAGAACQQKVKEVAEAEMAALQKNVEVDYQVSAPASDLKNGLIAACRVEGANLLVMGPGLGGKGSLPPYMASHVNGLTVCVVRDHLR